MQAFAFFAWSGIWFGAEFGMIGLVGAATTGALLVSRQPNNKLGWISLLAPAPAVVSFVLDEYALLSVIHHLDLPLTKIAFWTADWIWAPSLGIAMGILILRFPDGRVPRRFRFVEWVTAGGVVLFGTSLALLRTPLPFARYRGTSPLSFLNAIWPNRSGVSGLLFGAGFGLLAIAAVSATASLVMRHRHGDSQLRQQTKWIVLVFMAATIALLYAGVVAIGFSRASTDLALVPTYIAFDFLPIAIGVAILRYRLFDIDLIISRTLLYATLTAILGGLYVAVIELVQRVFVFYTGQKSDTAIVITAFVIAGAFTPIQKWLEGLTERRFAGRDIVATVHDLSSSAEHVVRVIDPHQYAHWLVDELVNVFEAEGGHLYLNERNLTSPFHVRGHLTAEPPVEIPVRHAERDLGRIVLGQRRGGIEYTHRDIEALRRAAAALGSALVVASDFGHVAHPWPDGRTGPKESISSAAREIRA